MPDILIRGMEMPEACADCSMCYDMMECTVSPLKFWYGRPENEQFDFCKERHPSCPLHELPPHGDLVDVNIAYDKIAERETSYYMDMDGVDAGLQATPVIVPASEEAANDPKT